MAKIEVGQVYRHFKGTYHKILNIALDSETLERMVVYNHVENDEVWVRPEKKFLEEIPERSDNVTGQKYRFELVKNNFIKKV